jgi:hypothetical protein
MSCVRTEGHRGHCSSMVGHLICRKNASLHLKPIFSAFTESDPTSFFFGSFIFYCENISFISLSFTNVYLLFQGIFAGKHIFWIVGK